MIWPVVNVGTQLPLFPSLTIQQPFRFPCFKIAKHTSAFAHAVHCWKCSSPRYSHDWLPHFLKLSAPMSLSQKGLTWTFIWNTNIPVMLLPYFALFFLMAFIIIWHVIFICVFLISMSASWGRNDICIGLHALAQSIAHPLTHSTNMYWGFAFIRL